MPIKLTDAEHKVMDVLWKRGDMTAKQVSDLLKEEIGWNMNTTYTIIKKCMAKGAIERRDPNFFCHQLVTREEVRERELDELIDRMYDGSATSLFASLLARQELPDSLLRELRNVAEEAAREEEAQ